MSDTIITMKINLKNGNRKGGMKRGAPAPKPASRASAKDPDFLSASERKKAPRVSPIKTIRRTLGLTQEEFARQFRLSLSAVKDWEQGRYQPDQAARSYLHVIAANPQAVSIALDTVAHE